MASKLLATVGGLAGHQQVEPLIRHIRQAAREVMGSEMCTVLLRDDANGSQLVGTRSEEEGGELRHLLDTPEHAPVFAEVMRRLACGGMHESVREGSLSG